MNIIHIKQPRRRTYTLQINRDGDLVVKTNVLFPKYRLNELISKHQDWIDKHIKEYNENRPEPAPLVRDTYSILGETFQTTFINGTNKIPKIEITGNSVIVKGLPEVINDEHEVNKALIKYFKDFAKEFFINRTYKFATKYGYDFNRVTIKNQKTKWGSCSTKRNLNFNWKLIFAPLEVLEYVVIHEVCHLKEMNHSPRFWKLVEQECPQYKSHKKWLRKNGDTIQTYV